LGSAAFVALAIAVVVYWVSVAVRGQRYSVLLDGWFVDGIELAAACLCIAGAWGRKHLRPVALALGAAMLSWAIGDVVATFESFGGAQIPVPSLADVFYLGFYPLAYLSAVLFLRRQLRGSQGPNWLDGLVASLGASALCAAFAFHGLEHGNGTGVAGTAASLAYPIGDLLLLGLAAGGFALVKSAQRPVWVLFAAGMGLVACGDTANLFCKSLGATGPGFFINAVAWPTAEILMAGALWAQRDRWSLRPLPRPPGLVIPALAACSAQAIVVVAALQTVDRVALGLAAATLAAGGARVLLWVGTVRALNQQNQLQAVTDDLTGLRNRRFMVGMLDDYFALRKDIGGAGPDMALLFVDLDHFKEVNDSFGHPVGDDLLRQLGARLRSCAGPSDMVARFGGDEFSVALSGVGTIAAIETAKTITQELARAFVLESVKVRIGASVGIAMASGASSTSELLWCADVAMYRAKQAGTGFAIYGEIAESAHSVQLVEELREAVGNGQLVVHYQPVLDLHSCKVTGAEALLRWVHPELGLLPPLEFLPLAEEAGLMPLVTEFVLSSALCQVAEWRSHGYDLSVSVNVSPASLLEEGFVESVRAELDRNHLPAEALVLEITENVVIRDVARTRATIERLSALGLIVSIDDFGAGATSLAYLRELGGIGELKLDRSFVVRLCHAEQQRELDLVRATIDLGHAMGLRVVAEGIEDAETLGILTELGCDLAQGYHISRPRPADELNFGPLLAATALT